MVMSPQRARTVANWLIVSGVGAAAYLIVSRPPLRRAVWNLSRPYLALLPVYLTREISTAWMESGRPS
jgi:hypothetical protein